ncbi:2'-5' RNA ligase family protein [Streptomyces bicolor]|uniref:2'-5' RNA ligase family protein n=1 Tax=Streptomyces bicolor TaxID=66874 RepID=UPI001F330191|nr:2'-5' RNA ligase family protein [Streptomyces bicolor]
MRPSTPHSRTCWAVTQPLTCDSRDAEQSREVLYLVPEPDTQLRQLTEAIADRWPEAPPYGGRFAEIVPHLTIAQGQGDAVLEEIETDLAGRPPFTSHVSSVELMVHDGTKWQEGASFALELLDRRAVSDVFVQHQVAEPALSVLQGSGAAAQAGRGQSPGPVDEPTPASHTAAWHRRSRPGSARRRPCAGAHAGSRFGRVRSRVDAAAARSPAGPRRRQASSGAVRRRRTRQPAARWPPGRPAPGALSAPRSRSTPRTDRAGRGPVLRPGGRPPTRGSRGRRSGIRAGGCMSWAGGAAAEAGR